MLTVLRAATVRSRDLFVVYELYDPDYDASAGFDPTDALVRFSSIAYTLPYGPSPYKRLVDTGPSVKKRKGKESNSLSLKLSNVDRFMAGFIKVFPVEQMRLVARLVSRTVAATAGNSPSVLSSTPVLFVGRCQQPDDFDRESGTISATPDLGVIESTIPPRRHQALCPLDFKGEECMGGEALVEKTIEFQQAVRCNFTKEQCTFYGNEKKFQGNEVLQLNSNFLHKGHQGFFSKLVNIVSFGLLAKRKKTTVGNSIHDGTPLGEPISIILGRWQKRLQMIEYQDIGNSVNWKGAACRGQISDIINLRTETANFTAPLGVTKHLGEYGGIGTQTEDTVFPEPAFHSRLAYATGYCNGTDIETEDPAPEISSLIAGVIPDAIYSDTNHSGTGKLAAGTGGVSAAGNREAQNGIAYDDYDALVLATPGLQSYFKIHETTVPLTSPVAGSLVDSGPNNWDGTLLDVSFPITLGNSPGAIERPAHSCVYGAGSIARIPSTGNGSGQYDLRGDQTWECWARISSHEPQSYMINKGTDTVGGVAFGLSFGVGLGTDQVIASWGNGAIGTGDGQLIGGPIVEDGRFYHIVTTRKANVIRLYINSCLVDEETDFPEGDIEYENFNDNPWRLGYTPNEVFGPVWLSQGLSHVAFYNEAIDQQTVADHYVTGRLTVFGCPTPDWTDNPVDHTRYLLTDPALLNNPEINDYLSAYAAAYCTGAIRDESNAERVLLPNTEVAVAGIDYIRYMSTGVLGPKSFDASRTQIPAGVPDRRLENVGGGLHAPGQYEFYDPAAPPDSLTEKWVYRKRFTNNVEINDPLKTIDFLYDRLFTTFRGFLWWDEFGRTVIDCERPADETELLDAAAATDDTLEVQDATHWKNVLGSPYLLDGSVLIGTSGSDISEVRKITLAQWSTAGNSVTLAASASGGPSAVASGANLTGGSTTVQASGTVTIGGSLTSGAAITVTINGFACVLDLVTGENLATIAKRMAAVINASPEVNRFVEAQGNTAGVVTVSAKCGTLTLDAALEEDHDTAIPDPLVAPSAIAAAGGSMSAGVYLLGYSYVNANGQTLVSVLLPVTLTAGQRISVADMTPLPGGVDSVNWFLSRSPNDTDLGFVENNDGTAFFINALPEPGAKGDAIANETGTLVTRIMMAFSGKAATWANLTRSNIIDGSFSWPDAKRQGFINRVKGTWREAVRDFGQQPGAVNDFPSQRRTRKQAEYEMDLSGTDNTNQAARLMNGKLNQFTEGKDFYKWGSAGEALLLVEGDLVAVSHDAGNPPFRNVLARVEDIDISARLEVSLNCRKYSRLQYDDTSAVKADARIERALSNFQAPPPAPTDATVTQSTTYGVGGTLQTSITGDVERADFLYPQRVQIWVTPPVDESTPGDPDTDEYLFTTLLPGQTSYTIPPPVAGEYRLRFVSMTAQGIPGGEHIEFFTVGAIVQTVPPPTNAQVTVVSGIAIITWDPPATDAFKVAGYVIYDNTGAGTPLMPLANVQQWSDNRPPGTYTVKLAAQDSMGNESTQVTVGPYTTTEAQRGGRQLLFEFNGNGEDIDPLTIPPAVLPFSPADFTIVEAYVKDLDDTAGSCEIDIRARARGLTSPGPPDSLVGSGTMPGTSTSNEGTLSDLSDWTTDEIDALDEVRAVIDTCTGHQHLMLVLTVLPR